jgi:hypothetical protein
MATQMAQAAVRPPDVGKKIADLSAEVAAGARQKRPHAAAAVPEMADYPRIAPLARCLRCASANIRRDGTAS